MHDPAPDSPRREQSSDSPRQGQPNQRSNQTNILSHSIAADGRVPEVIETQSEAQNQQTRGDMGPLRIQGPAPSAPPRSPPKNTNSLNNSKTQNLGPVNEPVEDSRKISPQMNANVLVNGPIPNQIHTTEAKEGDAQSGEAAKNEKNNELLQPSNPGLAEILAADRQESQNRDEPFDVADVDSPAQPKADKYQSIIDVAGPRPEAQMHRFSFMAQSPEKPRRGTAQSRDSQQRDYPYQRNESSSVESPGDFQQTAKFRGGAAPSEITSSEQSPIKMPLSGRKEEKETADQVPSRLFEQEKKKMREEIQEEFLNREKEMREQFQEQLQAEQKKNSEHMIANVGAPLRENSQNSIDFMSAGPLGEGQLEALLKDPEKAKLLLAGLWAQNAQLMTGQIKQVNKIKEENKEEEKQDQQHGQDLQAHKNKLSENPADQKDQRNSNTMEIEESKQLKQASKALNNIKEYQLFQLPYGDKIGETEPQENEADNIQSPEEQNQFSRQADIHQNLTNKLEESKSTDVFATSESKKFQPQKKVPKNNESNKVEQTPTFNSPFGQTFAQQSALAMQKAKSEYKSQNSFEDFHREFDDEREYSMEDLMIQQRQTSQTIGQSSNNEATNQQFEEGILQMLSKYALEFNEMGVNQNQMEMLMKSLSNSLQRGFNWSDHQLKALYYLREKSHLYSPSVIWRLNQSLVDQIVDKKNIKCSKIVQMQQGEEENLQAFKICIEFTHEPPQENNSMEQQELDEQARKLLDYSKQLKSIKIKPYIIQETSQQRNQYEQQIEDLTLLELQSILYLFNDLNIIDPCLITSHHSSQPFSHIYTIEDLCEHVLFPFARVSIGDEDGELKLAVDFTDTPRGIFIEPIKASVFTPTDEPPIQIEDVDDEATGSLPAVIHQNDQIQGGGAMSGSPQPNRNPPELSFNQQLRKASQYNAEINIYHLKRQAFKLVISYNFDYQSLLFSERFKRLNDQSISPEALQDNLAGSYQSMLFKIQPNVFNIFVDVQFGYANILAELFKKLDHTKFENDGSKNFESYEFIQEPQAFYDAYFKSYMLKLDELLKNEYKEWIDNELQLQSEQSEEIRENQVLRGHLRLFNLIISKKVVYIQMNMGEKYSVEDRTEYKTEMYVVLRDCRRTIATNTASDLKIVCLYSSANTDGQIRISEPLETQTTSVAHISQTFGQDSDLENNVQSSYILAQLCKIYLETISLKIQAEDKSDDQSFGSKSEGLSDVSSPMASKDSGSQASDANLVAVLVQKPLEEICYKRQIISHSWSKQSDHKILVPVTCSIIICKELAKIIGIRIVAMDTNSCHESGVFFLVDQSKWPRIEDAQSRFKSPPKKKGDEFTKYSLCHLMMDYGFNYLLDNFVKFETIQKAQRIVVSLQTNKHEPDQRAEAMQADGMDISSFSKGCTITQLERHATPDIIISAAESNAPAAQ